MYSGGSWRNWKLRMGRRRVPEKSPTTDINKDLPGPESHPSLLWPFSSLLHSSLEPKALDVRTL